MSPLLAFILNLATVPVGFVAAVFALKGRTYTRGAMSSLGVAIAFALLVVEKLVLGVPLVVVNSISDVASRQAVMLLVVGCAGFLAHFIYLALRKPDGK